MDKNISPCKICPRRHESKEVCAKNCKVIGQFQESQQRTLGNKNYDIREDLSCQHPYAKHLLTH